MDTSNGIRLPNGIMHEGKWYRYADVKEMDGDVEDLLTNKQVARDGDTFSRVCGVSVTCFRSDDGDEITDKSLIAKLVKQLPHADGTYLITRLRALSLGESFSFSASCPHCKKIGRFGADLSKQPTTFRDSPPKDSYNTVLPTGESVDWRILRMIDNSKILEAQRSAQDKMMTMLLFIHLTSVNGEAIHSYVDVKKWTTRSREFLREAIADEDFGMDNDVENTCPHCDAEFVVTLPVASESFFFPSGMRRR